VLAYDYSGYGISTGLAREKHQYEDIDAAWEYLTLEVGIAGDRIILYGQSIGSSPSTHKAQKLCRGIPDLQVRMFTFTFQPRYRFIGLTQWIRKPRAVYFSGLESLRRTNIVRER